MERLYVWMWKGLLEVKWVEPLLSANGLKREGEELRAPDGRTVGLVLNHRDKRFKGVGLMEVGTLQNDSRVVAWWSKPRSPWTIWVDGVAESGESLPPDLVICDRCNRTVLIRPVPVVDTYALCAQCFAESRLVFPGCIKPYIPYALLPTRPASVAPLQAYLKQITAAWREALPRDFLELAIFPDEETWVQGGDPERVGRYPREHLVRTQ